MTAQKLKWCWKPTRPLWGWAERRSRSMAGPWKDARGVIVTTTHTIEGRPIRQYLGIVTGEVIGGANIFRDLFANIREIVGGRSGSYERILAEAREQATEELKAKGAPRGGKSGGGGDLEYEVIGQEEIGKK